MFKQRPLDCFIQSNVSSIERSPSLFLVSKLKERFENENYLDLLSCNLRVFLYRIRTSSHSLRIQTETFSCHTVPRNERICLVCNIGEIEDEFQFILECPQYDSIRKKYIRKCFYLRPNMIKFTELFNSPK